MDQQIVDQIIDNIIQASIEKSMELQNKLTVVASTYIQYKEENTKESSQNFVKFYEEDETGFISKGLDIIVPEIVKLINNKDVLFNIVRQTTNNEEIYNKVLATLRELIAPHLVIF